MEKSLADGHRAITLPMPESDVPGPAQSAMPIRKTRSRAARGSAVVPGRAPKGRSAAAAKTGRGALAPVADGFYRDLVWNLRNGVLAVTRDGQIAVMNEV